MIDKMDGYLTLLVEMANGRKEYECPLKRVSFSPPLTITSIISVRLLRS